MLNLHVQYWKECETCGYKQDMTQEEADNFSPTTCVICNSNSSNIKDEIIKAFSNISGVCHVYVDPILKVNIVTYDRLRQEAKREIYAAEKELCAKYPALELDFKTRF